MEDTRSFDEVFVAVKYKIINKMPMLTAKEKLMENFVLDWTDAFGFEARKYIICCDTMFLYNQ